MDSTDFYLVVKNFTNLTPEEGAEVGRLSQQYPYCQLLQLVNARVARDHKLFNEVEMLHQSAVYSTDRAVLKWVMTDSQKERIQEIPKVAVREPVMVVQNPLPETIEKTVNIAPVVNITIPQPVVYNDVSLTGDDLRDDLMRELEKLQKLKHDFEISFDEFQKANLADEGHPKKSRVLKELSEPLLEELKSTKKKLKIDNPKQQEQNDIIDKFIKTQPIIPKAKPAEGANDLAEDSGMFSDNIVSETLVDILLKQGKKEKAIEVLKKLIWKFPQKKAYFAAQIENLKN